MTSEDPFDWLGDVWQDVVFYFVVLTSAINGEERELVIDAVRGTKEEFAMQVANARNPDIDSETDFLSLRPVKDGEMELWESIRRHNDVTGRRAPHPIVDGKIF